MSIMGGAIRPSSCACLVRRARSSAVSSMWSYGDAMCSWRKESRHRSGLRFLRYQTAAAVSGGTCARYRMVFWPCRVITGFSAISSLTGSDTCTNTIRSSQVRDELRRDGIAYRRRDDRQRCRGLPRAHRCGSATWPLAALKGWMRIPNCGVTDSIGNRRVGAVKPDAL